MLDWLDKKFSNFTEIFDEEKNKKNEEINNFEKDNNKDKNKENNNKE